MEGNEWLLEDNIRGSPNSGEFNNDQCSEAPLTDNDHASEWAQDEILQPDATAPVQPPSGGQGLISQVKGLVNNLIDSSTRLIKSGDDREANERLEAPVTTFAKEIESCYDYQRSGAQIVFGAFRFHTSQQFGKLRGVQTLRLPNNIFTHFSVHTSETRQSKNGAFPEGACQYGLFRTETEKLWVLARGYGNLGGVLPDWFCLNFMKRATARLSASTIDANCARNLIKHTFHELADDMLSLIEQIRSNENDVKEYGQTGIVATGGIWLDDSNLCVIGLCGNQQSYHLEIKSMNENSPSNSVPYCVTRGLFRALHVYHGNAKEKVRIQQRLMTLRNKNFGSSSGTHSPAKPAQSLAARRIMANLRHEQQYTDENPGGVGGSKPPPLPALVPADNHDFLGDTRKWCREILRDSCLITAGITRGFGFLDSHSRGFCSVPDFVIVQTKSVSSAGNKTGSTELILVASNNLFWEVQTPQEVASQILRIMHAEGKCLQDALDQVCMCVRVESVARGFEALTNSELVVICIPLIN